MLKTLEHRIYKFFKATSDVRWHFLTVAVLVPLMTLSLKLFHYRRTHLILGWLLTKCGKAKQQRGDVDILNHPMVLALHRVKRHGPCRGHCLSRSLVLWVLLRNEGIAAELIIGQHFQEGIFKAHAWLEYHGTFLNAGKKVHQHYTAFENEFLPRTLY